MGNFRKLARRLTGIALGAALVLGAGISALAPAARADTAATSNAAHAHQRYVIGVSGMT